jgi:hypothetical protein
MNPKSESLVAPPRPWSDEVAASSRKLEGSSLWLARRPATGDLESIVELSGSCPAHMDHESWSVGDRGNGLDAPRQASGSDRGWGAWNPKSKPLAALLRPWSAGGRGVPSPHSSLACPL